MIKSSKSKFNDIEPGYYKNRRYMGDEGFVMTFDPDPCLFFPDGVGEG